MIGDKYVPPARVAYEPDLEFPDVEIGYGRGFDKDSMQKKPSAL